MNYSKTFEQCMSWVFKSEGKYSNNKNDSGGCTNLGITIRTLRRWRRKRTTCSDVRRLGKNEAKKIYKKNYWDTVGGDRLPSGANYVIFDMGVNAGPSRGIKLAQRACRIRQDGKIGPITIKAINDMGGENFINTYARVRLSYYKRLRGWRHFGRGWRNRVNHSTKRALWLSRKFGGPTRKPSPKIRPKKGSPTKPNILMSKVRNMFPRHNNVQAGFFGSPKKLFRKITRRKEPELDILYGDDSDNSTWNRLKTMVKNVTAKK